MTWYPVPRFRRHTIWTLSLSCGHATFREFEPYIQPEGCAMYWCAACGLYRAAQAGLRIGAGRP